MSTVHGTDPTDTEQGFVEAFLSVIECAYWLAFEECDPALLLAAIDRDDPVLFQKITDKATEVIQDFAQKALAHQANLDDQQEESLLTAASMAAEVSSMFDKIVEDIETVKKYCQTQNVATTWFETATLLARALELGGRHRLLA